MIAGFCHRVQDAGNLLSSKALDVLQHRLLATDAVSGLCGFPSSRPCKRTSMGANDCAATVSLGKTLTRGVRRVVGSHGERLLIWVLSGADELLSSTTVPPAVYRRDAVGACLKTVAPPPRRRKRSHRLLLSSRRARGSGNRFLDPETSTLGRRSHVPRGALSLRGG